MSQFDDASDVLEGRRLVGPLTLTTVCGKVVGSLG